MSGWGDRVHHPFYAHLFIDGYLDDSPYHPCTYGSSGLRSASLRTTAGLAK